MKQIEAGGLTRTFRYLRDATEVSDSLAASNARVRRRGWAAALDRAGQGRRQP